MPPCQAPAEPGELFTDEGLKYDAAMELATASGDELMALVAVTVTEHVYLAAAARSPFTTCRGLLAAP